MLSRVFSGLCFFSIFIPILGFGQKKSLTPDFVRLDSIHIVRDSYGVPHIFAPTDAEVAYGLAWASCEDDFATLQKALILAKGLNGRSEGIEGAKIDYALGMLKVKETVEKRYETEISPSFKKYLKAFVAGVNRYAELHPEEIILKKAFPASEQDVICGFTLGVAFMSGVQDAFTKIVENRLPPLTGENKPMGSNAFAVDRKHSSENKSFIAINSHQPLEGMFSWYEAHLVSGEGLNILGGVFPGACIVGHGVNENIAWAHTLAYPDFTDIYKLKMHPKKKNVYRYDGEWKKLESKAIPLTVKLGKGKKGILLKVSKKGYWSEHGPVMKNDSGYFAFRMGATQLVKSAEQWFKMDKSKNFAEFKEALNMQSVPCFNIVYADRFDTIAFISNTLLPIRNKNYNWKNMLPGDTSAVVWDYKYYDLNHLPMIVNPAHGYVFNANNSPFLAAHPQDNLHVDDFPADQGHQHLHWNRSARLEKLFGEKERFSYDDFLRIKYDMQLPDSIHFLSNLDLLFHLDAKKYPEMTDLIFRVKRWNKHGDTANVDASLFLMAYKNFMESYGHLNLSDEIFKAMPEEVYVESLKKAGEYLMKNFGTLDVSLGKLQRLRRGNVDLPLAGLPDMLVATYSSPREDGTMQPWAGDSYIMMVKMSANGPEIETVHAFGASAKADSPHYTDQMKLFVNQQRKPMTLNRAEVFKNAEKIYSPR